MINLIKKYMYEDFSLLYLQKSRSRQTFSFNRISTMNRVKFRVENFRRSRLAYV